MSSTKTLTVPEPTRTTSGVQRPRRSRAGILLALLVIALAVLTATMLIQWTSGPDRVLTPTSPVPAGPPAAYLPGGSVYEEQVPAYLDWSVGYGPGSYLYDAQVPNAR